MATFRQKVIANLLTGLNNIKQNSSYELNNIKDVSLGILDKDAQMEYPTLTFYLGTDIGLTSDEGNGLQYRELDVVIFAHLSANIDDQNNGTLTEQVERFYSDMLKYFYNYKNIPSNATSTLNQIRGFQNLEVKEFNPYVQRNERKCTAGVLIKILYLHNMYEADTNEYTTTESVQV